MKKIIAVSILIISFGFTFGQTNVEWVKENFKGQEDEFKLASKEFLKGEKLFLAGPGNYKNAIKHFNKAYKFNPDNALLNYFIGRCLINSVHKEQAAGYFDTSYKLDSIVVDDILYELARAHHINEDWDLAISYYKKFEAAVLDVDHNYISAEFKSKINLFEKHIEECEHGKKFSATPKSVKIELLNSKVNTEYSEHSPVISANESILFFTSRRPGVIGSHEYTAKDIDHDKTEEVHYEDIFYCLKQDDGTWGKAINIGEPVNTKFWDATVSLEPDGKHMIFYRAHNNQGKLFEVTLENDEWTSPTELTEVVNHKHKHNPSAVFSLDKKMIIFASNRKEGNVGTQDSLHETHDLSHDLYYTTYDETTKIWSEAINFGPTVNTKYNERGVFLHADGKTLFFSSEGHDAMGGYDIFKTVLDKSTMTWSTPENLGYPINSAEDDIYFVLSGDGKTAYYSSEHKNGFGLHDIYKINFLKDDEILARSENEEHHADTNAVEVVEEVIDNRKLLLGDVMDSRKKEPIRAHFTVRDLHTHLVIAEGNSSSVTGKYEIEVPLSTQGVTIEVTAPGYLFSIDDYEFRNSKTIESRVDLIQVKKGAALTLNNIRFATNSSELSEESNDLLKVVVELLSDNPTLEIEIGGHTDNTGSESYNVRLSTKRAKAVVDYLIEQGIDENRLEYKGYGSEKPVGDNESETGRTENRRTELTVTKI